MRHEQARHTRLRRTNLEELHRIFVHSRICDALDCSRGGLYKRTRMMTGLIRGFPGHLRGRVASTRSPRCTTTLAMLVQSSAVTWRLPADLSAGLRLVQEKHGETSLGLFNTKSPTTTMAEASRRPALPGRGPFGPLVESRHYFLE